LPKYQTDCCKLNLERSTDPNTKQYLFGKHLAINWEKGVSYE